MSVPPEFYGNPNHRTLLLGNPGGRKSKGNFQINFCEVLSALTKKGERPWVAWDYDQDTEELERKGEVPEFHYEPNGENISTNREDGTTFGTLVAILKDRRAGEDCEFNNMVLE